MNSKEKRIFDRAPDNLKKIISLLPDGWKIVRHSPSYMGWQAELSIGDQLFKLVEEQFYISVAVLTEGKAHQIEAPADQRINISSEQVCAILLLASQRGPSI